MADDPHDRVQGDPLVPGAGSADPSETSRTGRAARGRRGSRDAAGTMIPARSGRNFIESFVMRLVATAGIIGIGVAIGAIMRSQNSHGWLIGLVVSIVSVILAGFLWSSRRL